MGLVTPLPGPLLARGVYQRRDDERMIPSPRYTRGSFLMSFPDAIDDLLRRVDRAREPEYTTLVEQAIREYESHFAESPRNGFMASLSLGQLAEKRSPVKAIRLRRKGLEWIKRFPAAAGLETMEARQAAEAYSHLARFRNGSEADALFGKAERALSSIAPDRLGALLVDQCADVLCRWADQERNSESGNVFERACRKFKEAHQLNPANKRKRLFRYAQALRRRASAVSGDRALELLAVARATANELLSGKRKDAALWQFLGLAAVLEAEKRSGRQRAWTDAADRCFQEALHLRGDAAGGILGNWALSLGLFAMSRSGTEAFELYAQANEKFLDSEKIEPKSRALRVNWSAILLREARERRGPAELWERAKRQAEKAEEIDQGLGAYNLACIASNLGDHAAVHRCLVLSAEFGHIVPLSQILRDVNFEIIRGDRWFRELLDGIFDSAVALASQ